MRAGCEGAEPWLADLGIFSPQVRTLPRNELRALVRAATPTAAIAQHFGLAKRGCASRCCATASTAPACSPHVVAIKCRADHSSGTADAKDVRLQGHVAHPLATEADAHWRNVPKSWKDTPARRQAGPYDHSLGVKRRTATLCVATHVAPGRRQGQ